MSAAATMPVLMMLLLMWNLEESSAGSTRDNAQRGSATMSSVDESVACAEVRCARCKGEVYMEVDIERLRE